MNKEEAIANLNMISIAFIEPVTKEQRKLINDTFEMAIKALSQEPTEKAMTVDEMEREYEKSKALFHKIVECEDAISREDALNSLIENTDFERWELSQALEAIEKLPSVTQKPIECEDAISREAVCDYIAEYVNDEYSTQAECDMVDAMIDGIQHLPSVTQKSGKWIPVSERLPEKNIWVLVTVEQNGNRYQEIMRRNNYIEAWTDNIDNYTDEITAWMPLPKPYEPQESEVNNG